MPSARAGVRAAAPSVLRARLHFAAGTGPTPVAQVAEPGAGPDLHSGAMSAHEVEIHDARPIADTLDLDRQGFVLTRHDSAVTDFYDEAQVRRVYYPEMERLVAAMTGAAKVVVFDHTIRVADDRKRAARKARDPVKRVHNDFTERSAPQRVRDLLPPDEAEARLAGRYASINVWRPIVGPVATKPLVVCGYPSLDSRDLVTAERHYPDGRIGGIYMLAFNPSQRWFYFPAMATDEAVLLKCFDSLTDGTARWTAHGSFDPPAPPPRAAPRESVEVRTLLFFDPPPEAA